MLLASPDVGRPAAADIEACAAILRAGSKSFAAASTFLPREVRAPAAALYAFCREADDAVDLATRPADGVAEVAERIARAYAGRPFDRPVDRAFSAVVLGWEIPREIPDALLEGFAWDAEGRRYENISDVNAYGARVAGTVGVMMTMLMGRRDAPTLARACDLGVAMQLSNIARDVGEDARRGRIYLPLAWMREQGIDADAWLVRPRFSPGLAAVVKRLLDEAELAYARADLGVPMLPRRSRVAIRAARLIYARIGDEVAKNGWDSVTTRAVVGGRAKLGLVLRALPAYFARPRGEGPAPIDEVKFLVDAVAPVPALAP